MSQLWTAFVLFFGSELNFRSEGWY